MSDHIAALRRVRWLFVAVLAALTVAWPFGVSAHTDFDSSEPTDEAVVNGAIDVVTVNFTNPCEPAGSGFVLLEPSGETREPTSVDATDGTSFVLTFEPPLTTGVYGLRWQVRAGDAHPIDGAFSFEVVDAVDVNSTPTTTAPGMVGTGEPAVIADRPDASSTTAGSVDLESFLAGDSSGDDAAWVGRVGRTFTYLGTVFGFGAVAALIWVIRGRRDELLAQLNWIRLAGLAIAVGGFVEWAGLHMTHDAVATELLDTRSGIAVALKIVGGLAVLVAFHPRAGRIVVPAQSLSAATLAEPDAPTARAPVQTRARWTLTASAAPGIVGFALVIASYWFDGHTVSHGNWAIHTAANFVHLLAAAVWAGGVFAMVTVVWLRRRAAEPTDTAAMIVRFSSVAAMSLVAVAVAGSAMAFMILDAPGDLFGTEWGRVLLAKTGAVAVAAGIGGYNHLRLRPALERRPDDARLAQELRRTLTVESAVFVVVVLLTSWLVAASF